ncbi:hypothetical protein IKW75_03125 [Candidatus Saccharibacteria bacterium]|nr:hypothetical protein [Candidatus Saccharibacteria bacterium]
MQIDLRPIDQDSYNDLIWKVHYSDKNIDSSDDKHEMCITISHDDYRDTTLRIIAPSREELLSILNTSNNHFLFVFAEHVFLKTYPTRFYHLDVEPEGGNYSPFSLRHHENVLDGDTFVDRRHFQAITGLYQNDLLFDFVPATGCAKAYSLKDSCDYITILENKINPLHLPGYCYCHYLPGVLEDGTPVVLVKTLHDKTLGASLFGNHTTGRVCTLAIFDLKTSELISPIYDLAKNCLYEGETLEDFKFIHSQATKRNPDLLPDTKTLHQKIEELIYVTSHLS